MQIAVAQLHSAQFEEYLIEVMVLLVMVSIEFGLPSIMPDSIFTMFPVLKQMLAAEGSSADLSEEAL